MSAELGEHFHKEARALEKHLEAMMRESEPEVYLIKQMILENNSECFDLLAKLSPKQKQLVNDLLVMLIKKCENDAIDDIEQNDMKHCEYCCWKGKQMDELRMKFLGGAEVFKPPIT